MPARKQAPHIKWEWSIGIGSVLNIALLLISACAFWFGLKGDVEASKASISELKNIAKENTLSNQAIVERTGKLEVAITFIAPALRRIEDHLSNKR